MKKAAWILLALLPLPLAGGGIKTLLGLHSSKYLFSSEVNSLNRQGATGLGFGAGYALDLAPKIQLEAHVLFGSKGAKAVLAFAADGKTEATYRNTALSLPLFISYRFRPRATPYVALGPEINLLLSHELSIPEYPEPFDLGDATQKLVFAFNVAAGYELPLGRWGLFTEIRYNRWVSDLLKGAEAAVNVEAVSFLIGGIYYL